MKSRWVEVEKTLLTVGERAPQCPEDTKSTPYVMKVSGFLADKFKDAELGDEVEITTLADRKVEGALVRINPSYDHSFGPTVSELLTIGKEELGGRS